MAKNKTAGYKIIRTDCGNVYQFYCDISGAMVHETGPYCEKDTKKELMLAWTEGENFFHLCHKCGAWVIGAMYNPDVLTCVRCTPIEDFPDFCPKCGAKTTDPAYFCHMCGSKLLYEGEGLNEKDESD